MNYFIYKYMKKKDMKEMFLKSFVVTYFILIQFLFLYFYGYTLLLKKDLELFNSVKNELKMTAIQRDIWHGYVNAKNKKDYKNKLRKRMMKIKNSKDPEEIMETRIIFAILPNLK